MYICYLDINFSLRSRRPRAVIGRKVQICCLFLVMLQDSQIKWRAFSRYPNFGPYSQNTFTTILLSASQH